MSAKKKTETDESRDGMLVEPVLVRMEDVKPTPVQRKTEAPDAPPDNIPAVLTGATAFEQAIRAAQKDLPEIDKDARNEFHGFSYTSAESMIKRCRESLLKFGLVFRLVNQTVTPGADYSTLKLAFLLTHIESSTSEPMNQEYIIVHGKNPLDKGLFACQTEAIAYALRGIFMLSKNEDGLDISGRDDRERVEHPKKQPVGLQTAKPATKPAPKPAGGNGNGNGNGNGEWKPVTISDISLFEGVSKQGRDYQKFTISTDLGDLTTFGTTRSPSAEAESEDKKLQDIARDIFSGSGEKGALVQTKPTQWGIDLIDIKPDPKFFNEEDIPF